MILGTPVPFTDGLHIEELLFQAKHIGETDDLIVNLTKGSNKYRHYLQAKKGFEINKNETFDKVIKAAYDDFDKKTFNKKHDKFIVFTDVLSKTDADDALTMLEWGRFSNSSDDFLKKLSLNKTKKNKYTYFKNSLNTAAGKSLEDDEIWCFLKCFYLKSNDYLSPGSNDIEVLKWYIKPYLKNNITPEQALHKLIDFIVISNQNGATLNIENVPVELKEYFELTLTDKISQELNELFKKSSALIDAIDDTIGDFHLLRDNYIDQINEAINQSSFIILTGDAGVGKSAIIKEYLNLAFKNGIGFISIKADILDKSSIAQTLSEIGVHIDIETIISQCTYLPRLIIYIDSFEKLYESDHSDAFIALLKKIKGRSNITLFATCREYAYETLRKKFKITTQEIINIPVHHLTKVELNEIVKAKPQLKKLIQNPRLHKMLSLPYYLDQALRLSGVLTETENITESEFKVAIWEQGVEKKGSGRVGHSKKRGLVFSKIILKRAIEKQSYITCDESDLEIAEELFNEGFLIKHAKNESYAPQHDILEDIVVGKFLDKKFDEKENTKSFIESIDTNPVMRRGLRTWIQELILTQPDEAKIFLKKTFALYIGSASIIDELLIGILGSEDCYTLLSTNQDLILADNLKLFYRLLHLLKVAYSVNHSGNPKRNIKCFGPGWDALVGFLNNNYSINPAGFDIIVTDLFMHWTYQYEIDEECSDSSKDIANFCLLQLQFRTQSQLNVKELLQILFFVLPSAENEVGDFLRQAIIATKTKKNPEGIPVNFYSILNKMLLKEPYKCNKVYKYFPNEIIELAKIEWYSEKLPTEYSSNYQESSFGLVSYPYDYFSPSALQTPISYLLKYNFKTALDFIIEMTNRGMKFYVKSSYARDLSDIKIILNDGTQITQLGHESLFSAYRGTSPVPYLIQSVLMALETNLLNKASQGEDLSDTFLYIMKSSNSVLLTGIFVSVAIANPFCFGKEINAILKIKVFFNWDINRYSTEFVGINSTTIGNDLYYTSERHQSNQLNHRAEHLETLVFKLQLYRFEEISSIIDTHLQNANPKDLLWKLALTRMDIRNTEPEIMVDEEAKKIAFVPKAIPVGIQKMLDESNKDQHHDTNAISIFLYSEKLFKGELGESPSVSEWQEKLKKLKSIDLEKGGSSISPEIIFATAGLKVFSKELLPLEKEFCLKIILNKLETAINDLKKGGNRAFDQLSSKSIYYILPKLFSIEFNGLVDIDIIKINIIDLLLLSNNEIKKELIEGIKQWLWNLNPEFANQCFQICLNNSFVRSINENVYHLHPLPKDIVSATDRLIQEQISKPDLTSDELSIIAADRSKIIEAIELIPYDLLSNQYFPFLESIVKQLSNFNDLDNYEETVFVNKLEELLGHFLMSETNEKTTSMVYRLLFLSDTHLKFVMNIFKWVNAIGHDANYPDVLWDHFSSIWEFMLHKNPKIGFLQIILLTSIERYNNKLPVLGKNKILHKTIVSNPAIANSNIISNVFKLLSGIGSSYQPESLNWLMLSIPFYENYTNIINTESSNYLEKYVTQLYENHIDHIKVNKTLLNYYIMLLNVLISSGSREAFRIRDIIL